MASRKWWNKASLVASIALVCGCVVLQPTPAAAQDQGPILVPKPKPQTTTTPTLLVLCDLTCDWKLDGVAQGRIDGGASAKVKVELGQHLVVVVSASNSRDRIERMVEVKGVGQTLVNLKLEPIRDARLQAEQNARQQQSSTTSETTPQTQQSTTPQSDASVWTDPATGLMWTRHDNNADANWNEAGSYCQNLALDGHTDWRLPTVQDLQGILDLSQSSQCGTETCHIKGNIQLTTKWVWTSTPGGEAGHAMYFRFSEGQYLSYPYTDRQLDRVLCVRAGTGGQSAQVQPQTQPQQTAAPQSDASVWVDPGTNLMWTRHDNNADANWNEAGSYCQNLRLDGYSGWQLPTVQDLQGILDLSQSSTCGTETCHIKGNIQLSTKWVWTSTPGGEAGHAMYFRFSEGQYLSYPYTDRQLDRVLCVRPAGSVAAQNAPTGVPSVAVWTDPATGLMWQRSDSGDNNDLTWQQAVNYCRGNSAGGYSGWRLPTVDELVGIYDTSQSVAYQCCKGTSSGVMHVKGGIQMSGEEWTSSESDDGNGAYRIWLSDSSHSVWTKTENYEGRGICVRATR